MQTRDIKRRIRSVKNTQQITRAMKFVAAAKLRRAQERMLAMRPYADRLGAALRHVAVDLVGDEHPLFHKTATPARVATVIIAGDRGLCGGFNTNVFRAARHHFENMPNVQHSFFAIGRRAAGMLKKTGRPVVKQYADVFEKLSYTLATDICEQLVALVNAKNDGHIDAAYLVYNEFVGMMTQKPVVRQLLPLDFEAFRTERKAELDKATREEHPKPRPLYELEPSAEAVLERLVSRQLATVVYRGTLESYAAELAARMTAMDNATNNAEEMLGNLTLIYNRVRQAGITTELLDIIGGANALA
jgi:F-type H+-transporting ATPase subunit gamma